MMTETAGRLIATATALMHFNDRRCVRVALGAKARRALERPPCLAPRPSGWIRRKPNLWLGTAASPAPEANANTSSQTIDALTRPPTLPLAWPGLA
jgi:hypothetical protein